MPNPRSILLLVAFAGCAVLFTPLNSGAQIYEAVGVRAQGMGGAFVAVADDATATWWNPAGLATGAYFSAILERGRAQQPGTPAPGSAAWRADSTAFSIVFPALGLSYYRLRVSEIRRPTSEGVPALGREDPVGSGGGLASIAVSQYGATAGQSLGDHVVVASTIKLVRAGQVVSAEVDPAGSLSQAARLEPRVRTHGDLDLGVMARLAYLRVGLSVKHLGEPKFGSGTERFVLTRQARLGGAVFGGKLGPLDAVSASVDADLTALPTAAGDARYLAAGFEAWMFGRLVGVRAGVSGNTAASEASGRSLSSGLSLSPAKSVYIDAAAVMGSDLARKGWSLGGRLTF